jgi:hypothetical protein
MSLNRQWLYLVISGAQHRGLCCWPSMRGEGREMKWGRDRNEKGQRER